MPVVIIRAGTIWDGVSDAPLGPRDILIKDSVIKEIAENIPVPEGAEVINLRDRMVMPGLIDCHVHLTLRPEISPTFWSHSGSYKALLGAQALRILLMNGFTTVRDMGDMDLHGFTTRDLKTALAQGIIPGSRLITSGHMISCRGGHMDVTALLSPGCNVTENCLADGPDEIRTVVRNEIKWGADWIKYAASGGFASPSDDPVVVTYTQEEMDALVATATTLKRPVAAHIHGDDAVRMSVLAGVRSVEHGAMASKETLALIEEKGVYLIPTQYAGVRSARFADSDEYWDAMGASPYMKMKIRKYKDALLETARNLAKSNVKIAFGTDLGISSFAINGATEFGEMVANGISPVRALRAATSVAAELLMKDDIGTLAPGKCADIVAVPGNPFEDITVMEKVSFVMKAGIVCKQA
jgi:tryptophan 2-monooxygenase